MPKLKCVWITEGVKCKCQCSPAYSRCYLWVRWDEARGDRSQGHGGWGWRI